MERRRQQPQQEPKEEWLRRMKKERQDRYGLTKLYEMIEEKARKKEEASYDKIALERAEWEGMIKPKVETD